MTAFFPDTASAVCLSLEVGLWCVLLLTPISLGLGYVLARGRFFGRSLLSLAVLAPLVLPPVVLGYLLLSFFSERGWYGQLMSRLGLQFPIVFSFAGAVAAAMIVGLPFYVIASRGAFEAVDPRYAEVAVTLGQSPWRTFFRVTLPLAYPGLLAGALLAFARALGEFGATVVLAGNVEGRTRTISLALYALLDAPEGESHMLPLLLASLALAFSAIVVFGVLRAWQDRRLERGDHGRI